MSAWTVAVVEHGLGDVVWTGEAPTAAAALRAAFPDAPDGAENDLGDVNGDGSLFEIHGGGFSYLAIEVVR